MLRTTEETDRSMLVGNGKRAKMRIILIVPNVSACLRYLGLRERQREREKTNKRLQKFGIYKYF